MNKIGIKNIVIINNITKLCFCYSTDILTVSCYSQDQWTHLIEGKLRGNA